MSDIPRLVGMIHLGALPGSPLFAGSLPKVLDAARSDAAALAVAGFPALLVENFGDVPFHPGRVEAETVASMTLAVAAVAEETGLPLGVNVLRNDAGSALAIASATGASFIRVNVLAGTMFTDQGPIVGPAAELMRRRASLAPEVEVWADVMVKHATPPPGTDPGQAAEDLVRRALADAVIVSGPGTGRPPDQGVIQRVAEAARGTRLVIGSGATRSNLASLLSLADTVIVGSSIKVGGDPTRPVDPVQAAALVEAARDHGLA